MVCSEGPFFLQITGQIERHHQTRRDQINDRKIDNEDVVGRVQRSTSVEGQNCHQISDRSNDNVKGGNGSSEVAERLDCFTGDI